ncbi:MAG: hypothetical protein ACYSTY_13560, partial [Planctomycetota bacterium]
MSRRRRAGVEKLREELACPRCEYSLKGLRGDVVTCPECGTECDLAKLMLGQWVGPWYRAPGFGRILAPVACVAIGMWGVGCVGVLEAATWASP